MNRTCFVPCSEAFSDELYKIMDSALEMKSEDGFKAYSKYIFAPVMTKPYKNKRISRIKMKSSVYS